MSRPRHIPPIETADLDETQGFPPVSMPNARVLVLGSLPGRRSVQEQQYYAHPQNTFWRIMQELTGADGSYEARCEALRQNGIALWDVLKASVRPGSMDADIRMATAEANDFNSFFRAHPQVVRLCFNGQKARQLFDRLVRFDLELAEKELRVLPSTSPAFAAMRFEEKLAAWREALGFAVRGE